MQWDGSDEDIDMSDMSERNAHHTYRLVIVYSVGPDGLKWTDAHDIIAQDRHDLILTLRNQGNRVGYDADNTTTDIGIMHRWRVSDDLATGNPTTWTLEQRWRCTVNEAE